MQYMTTSDRSRLHHLPGNHIENGSNHDQPNQDNAFLSGIKQRLLSFIFRGIWNEETDQTKVGQLTSYLLLYMGSEK